MKEYVKEVFSFEKFYEINQYFEELKETNNDLENKNDILS